MAPASAARGADADAPEPGEIDRRLGELRERRGALMDALRDVERHPDARRDPVLAIDAMELRVHLNEVHGRWRALLARAVALDTWAPLGSEPPRFESVLEGEGCRVARALIPLTPDSLLFVHGPAILWHAAVLAEGLLGAGDRLVALKRAAFHRELAVEPLIVVWDAARGAPPRDVGGAAADGVLATARGRELAFAALPDGGRAPARRAGWHPVAARIIAARPPRSPEPGAFAYRLTPAHLPEAAGLARGSAVLLAKAEAIVAVFTQHILVGERVLLLSRVADLPIEPDLGAWLAGSPEVRFELDWGRQRAIPGRGRFVPLRYGVDPDEGWRRSVFVCLDSHLVV